MSKRESIVDIFLQNPDYTQKKIAEIAKVFKDCEASD